MSESIDQVMKEFSEVFIARKDDVEFYLKKYYDDLFSNKKVKNVERIDATRLIKTLGFRKNLTSWRNSYDNLVISTCVKIKGDKKRFNYKFYFIEEKLEPEILKQLENLITEINNLKDRYDFLEAFKRVTFAEKLIKGKNDVFFNKRLNDLKIEILNAEKAYNSKIKIIESLEKDIQRLEIENKLKMAMEKAEKIIQLSRAIKNWEKEKLYTQKNIDLKKKYDLNLDSTINDLEDRAFLKKNEKLFNKAINCYEQIISLLKKNKKNDLIEAYQSLIEEIKSEQEKFEEERLLKKKKIEDALNKYYQQIDSKRQEQAILIKKAQCYGPMIEIQEDMLPLVEDFSVEDILGDLSENIHEQYTKLEKLLEEHRVDIKTNIKNKGTIIKTSGEIMDLEQDINANMSGDDEKEVFYDVHIKLENHFDEMIEEAILSDLVPYNFEIVNTKIDEKRMECPPEKILTKDGLEITCRFKDIRPKEKIEIVYDLRHRVSRTIIFIREDQLNIIKTHANLEDATPKKQGFHEANINFINPGPAQIKGMIIEDIIPLYYIHSIIEPRTLLPIVKPSNKGDQIEWKIGTMDVDSINHRYKLIELFKFEEIKVLVNGIDEKAYNCLKNNNINESIEKYNEIVGLINDFLS